MYPFTFQAAPLYDHRVPDLFARHLRANQTEAEKRLWSVLRDFKRRGFHVRRQVRIGPYVADFAILSAKLIVELGGSQHDETPAQAHDAARTAFLNTQGFTVLRFWNDQVFVDAEKISISLYPPPPCGEGLGVGVAPLYRPPSPPIQTADKPAPAMQSPPVPPFPGPPFSGAPV